MVCAHLFECLLCSRDSMWQTQHPFSRGCLEMPVHMYVIFQRCLDMLVHMYVMFQRCLGMPVHMYVILQHCLGMSVHMPATFQRQHIPACVPVCTYIVAQSLKPPA